VRILYIVTAFPRWPGDVITPWLTETIHRLRARGVEVEVLAPGYKGMPSGEWNGITVHRFHYAPAAIETLTHDQTAPDRIRERPWLVSLLPGYITAGSLAAIRLARTGRFDAIHAFWPIPHGLLGLAGRRFSGVPLVSTFFGVELTWLRRQFPFLAPIARRIIRRSDAVTVISSYTAGEVSKLVPGARIRTIPFGAAVSGAHSESSPEILTVSSSEVPPESLAGTPPESRPDSLPAAQAVTTESAFETLPHPADRPFQLLFIGRLVERKGVSFLLRAVAALRGRGDDVRLRIVGNGPLKDTLQAESSSLSLGDAVEFTGFIPENELSAAILECDAFVLPAVTDSKGDVEGLGVVLIEAMTHGRPVIASDSGGIRDIVVDGESGLLVASGDVDALAAAISRLCDDPVLRAKLAVQGQRYAERHFSWDRIMDDLVALYHDVAAAAPHRSSSATEDDRSNHAATAATRSGGTDPLPRLICLVSRSSVRPRSAGLRVLHLIYDDLRNPWVAGGGAVRTFEIYRHLVPRLESVTVATGAYPGSRDEVIEGVRYLRLGAPAPYLRSRVTYSWQASRLLARGDYDVAVVDFSTYAPIRMVADHPVGVTVHHITGDSAVRRWGPVLGRLVALQERMRLRKGRVFSATSAETGRKLRLVVGDQKLITSVQAGVPDGLFALPRRSSGSLLYFGRLDWYQKGLDTLLDAMAILVRDHPSARMQIAGRGRDVDLMRGRIAELGLEDHIELLGPVSDSERDRLFSEAAVMLMPSRFEGFGMVAAEAMAAGIPLVASDVDSLPEVVSPPAGGILVPPGDAAAFARAAGSLLEDPVLRETMSRSARAAAERFRWSKIAQDHLAFLEMIHTYSAEEKS
jgi:glycosyltransferase involved in cell wall biosynthesis